MDQKAVFANERSSLKVPNASEICNRGMSISPEVVIEPMQPHKYANLNESIKQDLESPRLIGDTTVELSVSELRLPTLISSSDYVDSSTECLGAAGLKSEVVNQSNTSEFHMDNDTCGKAWLLCKFC